MEFNGVEIEETFAEAFPMVVGRILVTAFAAAVPVVALIQLHLSGVGVIELVVGGVLYLFMYLTLAPVLGAVDKFDIMNLRTIMSFGPLQYFGVVEVRLATFTELGQNRLDQNILEIMTLGGNVMDLTLTGSRARPEQKDRNTRAYVAMTKMVSTLVNPIFDYELKLFFATRRN